MAEINDEEVCITFTVDGRSISYIITKLPPPIPGLNGIQKYFVKIHPGVERIIYTDDLSFWKKLKENHYNIFRDETFNYSIFEKDIKRPDYKEFLFALLGKDFLGPENLIDNGKGISKYIGALIQGEDGHYTVNKKQLVEAVIPFLDKKMVNSDKENDMSLKDLFSQGTKGMAMKAVIKAVDYYVFLERMEEKRQLESLRNENDGER